MAVKTLKGFRPGILFDENGNPIDSVVGAGGLRRLAVDAALTVKEIQIGAVELDDGEGSTRGSVKEDAAAISAAPNGGGLLIAGRDIGSAVQRHVRVDSSGRLIVVGPGSGGVTLVRNDESITESTQSQDLSAAPLDFLVSPGADFRLNMVMIRLSGVTVATQTFTVTVEPTAGAAFNTVIRESTIAIGSQNIFYQPDSDLNIASGGSVRVQLTNTGTPAITANALVSTELR